MNFAAHGFFSLCEERIGDFGVDTKFIDGFRDEALFHIPSLRQFMQRGYYNVFCVNLKVTP
jgi:hypothetical protein